VFVGIGNFFGGLDRATSARGGEGGKIRAKKKVTASREKVDEGKGALTPANHMGVAQKSKKRREGRI